MDIDYKISIQRIILRFLSISDHMFYLKDWNQSFKGSGSHLQSQNVRLDKNNGMYRSKYHVETLLKNQELETKFKLTYYQ